MTMLVASSVIGDAAAQPRAAESTLDTVTVTVTVEASQDTADGGTRALGQRSVRDTPFSISIIDSERIEERQIRSVADAFFSDPSVTPFVNDDGVKWSSAGISVRGLPLSSGDGSKLDGLAIGTSSTEWPLELVDRVELLKESSGFLYGFGAPGGVVNYVSKRPTDAPLRRCAAQAWACVRAPSNRDAWI